MSNYRQPIGSIGGQSGDAIPGQHMTRGARPAPRVSPAATPAPDPVTGPPVNTIPATPDTSVPQPSTLTERAVRPSRKARRSPAVLLNIPIAGRLTLGFLIAALFATLAAGLVGSERSQSLTKEADFYQQLLQTNTSLNIAASYLQLMNTKLHEIDSNLISNAFSQETQDTDEKALQSLATHYNAILSNYIKNSFIDQHPDQLSLLTEAGNQAQAGQQHILAASVQRTWMTYSVAQETVLQGINAKNAQDAHILLRAQAEPTNADALSAMRTLIQLGSSFARSVNAAAAVEQQTLLITTLIIAGIASLCIGLFGWFISRTLVKRLNLLRRVTQRVEQGHLDSRVMVIGRDEIADVSLSVNAMLDTIVGLFQETRSQRDAMTNAANHLFSYMQVMSAGELRTNTVGHNDPIGMLADAFNFTIGRVRRFIMRTQTSLDRLEVILHQNMEHNEHFLQVIKVHTMHASAADVGNTLGAYAASNVAGIASRGGLSREVPGTFLITQLKQAQQHLLQGTRTLAHVYIHSMLTQLKKISTAIERVKRNEMPQHGWKQQEIHELEVLVRELETVMQTMQASASKELSEVEQILHQSLIALRTGEREASPPAASGATEMARASEMTQLSRHFVQNSTVLIRQVNAIAQELRMNVSSFNMGADEEAPFSASSAASGKLKS